MILTPKKSEKLISLKNFTVATKAKITTMSEISEKLHNLTELQRTILLYLREGMTDEEIAKAAGIRNRSVDAVRKHIANIGEALFPEEKEKEGRSQYRKLLKKLDIPRELLQPKKTTLAQGPLEPLTGVVPIDSSFYITRDSNLYCQEILKANNNSEGTRQFIRIRGPQQTGKSSLLRRLQNLAIKENQIVAFVDLGGEYFESEAFENLTLLLQRFTEAIADGFSESVEELNPPNLTEYWQENKTPGLNCTQYLNKYVFSQIHQPKLLLLDGLDKVLGTSTQTPFFEFLRSWYERKMKKVTDNQNIVWPSIAIAYSTEPYPEKDIKGSVLQNTATLIELEDFTPEQVRDLAGRYGLKSFSKNEIDRLMKLIGGHPALINQALYKIGTEGMTMVEIESQATMMTGPFGDYLYKKFQTLNGNESLLNCCEQAMTGNDCEDLSKFQLLKAGLIDEVENGVKFKYEIYRQYYEENLESDRQNYEETNEDMEGAYEE